MSNHIRCNCEDCKKRTFMRSVSLRWFSYLFLGVFIAAYNVSFFYHNVATGIAIFILSLFSALASMIFYRRSREIEKYG